MTTRTKRCICCWIGALALIWVLGLVGGLECELISVGGFCWRAALCGVVGVAALAKGGWLR